MQTRLYPWAVGIPMLILALLQVILDLKGYKAETNIGWCSHQTFSLLKRSNRQWQETSHHNVLWLFGFFLMVWLLGFDTGFHPVFCDLKFQSNESWGLSIILTILVLHSSWFLVKLLTAIPRRAVI